VVNQGNNSVSAYRLDAASGVARIDSDGGTAGIQTSIPARSSPISIAFHPEGGYAYVANALSGDISVFSIDNGISGVGASGTLTAIDANGPIVAGTDTFVNLGIGAIPYSVAVSPDGKHLYVANGAGGVNGVFHYAISPISSIDEGALNSAPSTIAAGTSPRAVAIHPSGLYAYVVNSGSSNISGFDIDSGTGVLTPMDVDAASGIQTSIATGSTPISIRIDRSGTFAYVANYGTTGQGNTVSVYQINPSGQLTLMETKTVGTGPSSVATAP
jgi:DNA-binding beta-propeller fold protein YncE